MPENNNPQVESNAVSDQSTDSDVKDAFGRLKIGENEDRVGGAAQSSPYPDRPSEPDCLYYLRTGSCGYGSNCRFNHPASAAQGALYYRDELPERVGQPDCDYFLKTGTCKYGSTCKFHHPKDRNGAGPVSFNILGLPMRQDEKSCPYYMRTGSCKFGSTCKFHHPQPSLGAALPVNGAATYGPSILPSPALPYVSGFPTWSLPRAPYMAGPHLQSPQGYVPVMVSPSQGMVSLPGLNTYLDNASSVNIFGSNPIHKVKKQGDTSSSVQVNSTASSSQNYPERPDQQECRYYMNTGTCKFGSDCKYHHPKERIAQLATNTVTLPVLPSRPGQSPCPNYLSHGICKFGPACRYDHPFFGYPYTYGLSLPHLSMFDTPSYLTYPRISAAANTSEPSPPIPSKYQDRSKNPNTSSSQDKNPETQNSSEQAYSDSSPHIPPETSPDQS